MQEKIVDDGGGEHFEYFISSRTYQHTQVQRAAMSIDFKMLGDVLFFNCLPSTFAVDLHNMWHTLLYTLPVYLKILKSCKLYVDIEKYGIYHSACYE